MTSNKLKIIAVIFMIIDHFAYYFNYVISSEVYTWCRILGRISMPIFVYLLVQGYFNTKSIRRYKMRVFIAAVITQALIIFMKYININYYSSYTVNIYEMLNILFSMFLSLVFICLIDRKIIYDNTFLSSILDKFIRICLMFVIVALYMKLPFDYKYFLPILAVGIYIVEKLREFFEWKFASIEYKACLGVVLCILLLISGIIVAEINSFSIIALIFILLYNGKLGKKSNFSKYIFYLVFPLQHIILYFIGMILYNKLV